MFRKTLYATLLAGVILPGAALADGCPDALKALRGTYTAGTVDEILSAVSVLRSGRACNDRTTSLAISQASGVLANRAGRFVAQGDYASAEEILARAPGLHWAVQAVRGDIAAARGNRDEAAQLYNAALDTIMDPVLTPPDEQLIPVAERLAQLAQENIMLAGTLDGTVTRGGSPSGVLKAAKRGISIESTTEPDTTEVAAGAKPTHPPPEDKLADAGHAEQAEAEEKTAEAVPDKTAEEPKRDLVLVEAEETVVPEAEVEASVVADGVAKVTKTVFLPIKFDTNSDYLDDKARYEAEYIGAFLKANDIQEITLVGHTDERGSDSYNLDLSYRRAQAVRDYLTHYLMQYDAYTYIHVDGQGERKPPRLSDPYLYSTEERQAIARRVELVLHR